VDGARRADAWFHAVSDPFPPRPRPATASFGSQLLALAFTALLVLCPVFSVVAAGWVTGLSALIPLALGGVVTGALFARLRLPPLLLHLAGVFAGEFLAVWTAASTLPGTDMEAQLTLLARRVADWLLVVRRGGVGTDNLLFLLALAALAWFIGYSAAFMVARADAPWWGIMTAGAALFVNVSYSGHPVPYVPFFLVVALLLVVQSNAANQEHAWRRAGLGYPRSLPFSALPAGLAAALLLVAGAMLLPTGSAAQASAEQLRSLADAGDGPLAEVKAELSRMFGGIQGSSTQLSSAFGSQLTLQSEFHLGQEVVAEVAAARGRYWRAVTYQEYTGRGWRAAPDTTALSLAADEPHPSAYQARAELEQIVTVRAARGDALIAAGQPTAFGVPAAVSYESGTPGDPLALDLASAIRSPRARFPGLAYRVVSAASTADEAQLRAAGTDYPALIRQRYGRPVQVPGRVTALARQLAPADLAPYDRAKAIEAYLRTLTYQTTVPAPPPGRDGVDFFLFDSKVGYCDYFASAMVAMLRQVGVPARVASGYAIGELDQGTGRWVVRDANAHSWAEVYFPRYGWIEFEPSPIRPVPTRGSPAGASAAPTPTAVPTPANAATTTPAPVEPTPSSPVEAAERRAASLPFVPILLVLGAAALIAAGARAVWRWGIADLPPAEAAYARMARLATLLGRPPRAAQTPREFADSLSPLLGPASTSAATLADAYVASRWSRAGAAIPPDRLDLAWRQVRGAMLRALLPYARTAARPQ
jgi:transglutaminase-like putative cysteine protease